MKTKEVIPYIVNWLIHYVRNSPCKGFVVGVSGGIDSAVTSALVAKTGFPVYCIEIPIHQEKNQLTRSADHISWLKKNHAYVNPRKIELDSVFEEFKNSIKTQTSDYLKKQEKSPLEKLALANTRSRFRMSTLYFFAQLHNSLVVGTGNKIEDFGIGFFTKYGDGGVDISPIADLLKTEVYLIGKELGICQSILDAKPTDGLWNDKRTDEDQIGASYEELEWAMQHDAEYGSSKSLQISLNAREKEVFNIYKTLNQSTKHKIQKIPICKIPENLK